MIKLTGKWTWSCWNYHSQQSCCGLWREASLDTEFSAALGKWLVRASTQRPQTGGAWLSFAFVSSQSMLADTLYYGLEHCPYCWWSLALLWLSSVALSGSLREVSWWRNRQLSLLQVGWHMHLALSLKIKHVRLQREYVHMSISF